MTEGVRDDELAALFREVDCCFIALFVLGDVVFVDDLIIAEVAVRTDENSFEYPAFSISGTSIFASIAASARLLPESPPIKVDNSTLTCPRPPVILLVSALQKFIILFVTPV